MAGFDDRRDAYENKFAHDEELRFKAVARRNRAFGLWAAAALGRSDGEDYAKSVILSDFAEPGDGDVLRKVKADFDAAGVATTEQALRTKMDELMATVAAELTAGR